MNLLQFALAYGAGALSTVLGLVAYVILFGSVVMTKERGFPRSRGRRDK